MQELLSILAAELSVFLNATDNREHPNIRADSAATKPPRQNRRHSLSSAKAASEPFPLLDTDSANSVVIPADDEEVDRDRGIRE